MKTIAVIILALLLTACEEPWCHVSPGVTCKDDREDVNQYATDLPGTPVITEKK